jgi:chromosome segregation ATPase
LIVLEKEVIRQGDDIIRLENWIGEKDAVFATLQNTDAEISTQVEQLVKNNQQLEKDLQNLAVLLRGETQKREELAGELEAAKSEILVLREDRSVVEELRQELGADVNAQINAALIREQRLERQIKTLEEEFTAYRTNAEKELKSAKTLAIVGIAVGAIGAVVGIFMAGGN